MNILPEGDGMGDYLFPQKRRKFKWHRWIYAGLIALLVYGLFFHDAMSHDFYTLECCNDRDCSPLPDGAVQITPDGYVWKGEIFPYGDRRIKYSPDGKYHGCEMPNTKVKLCLYVPPQGA